MRWFRRRSADPPRPATTVPPTPELVVVEPAAEPEPVIEAPPAVDGTAPRPAESARRRHWYPAGGELRLPAARPPGAARAAASRVGSGGWHRV